MIPHGGGGFVMSNTEPVEIGLRVTAALDFLRSGGEEMRDHYLWCVRQVMSSLPLDEVSTSALVSILAVLVPEHARFLRGREPGTGVVVAPLLKLIRDGDGTAGDGSASRVNCRE